MYSHVRVQLTMGQWARIKIQPTYKSFPADTNPAGCEAYGTIDFHINFVHWDVVSCAPDRGSHLHIVNIMLNLKS